MFQGTIMLWDQFPVPASEGIDTNILDRRDLLFTIFTTRPGGIRIKMVQINSIKENNLHNAGTYTLAILAAISGIFWTLYTVYVSSGGQIFILALALAILFSGLSAYLTESYIISILLGLLPIYGVGVGEVITAPYKGPLLVGIINILILFSLGGIILSTSGFLIGIIARYRRGVINKKRWLALRIVTSAFICLVIYIAARNGWISYSVPL